MARDIEGVMPRARYALGGFGIDKDHDHPGV